MPKVPACTLFVPTLTVDVQICSPVSVLVTVPVTQSPYDVTRTV